MLCSVIANWELMKTWVQHTLCSEICHFSLILYVKLYSVNSFHIVCNNHVWSLRLASIICAKGFEKNSLHPLTKFYLKLHSYLYLAVTMSLLWAQATTCGAKFKHVVPQCRWSTLKGKLMLTPFYHGWPWLTFMVFYLTMNNYNKLVGDHE